MPIARRSSTGIDLRARRKRGHPAGGDMQINGTLHLYSGDRRELFFVFADSVAQQLYKNPALDIDDPPSRVVSVSIGNSRFISERTLSFSRKQSEIKVSLCSRNSKEGLKDLTGLYNWFASQKR